MSKKFRLSIGGVSRATDTGCGEGVNGDGGLAVSAGAEGNEGEGATTEMWGDGVIAGELMSGVDDGWTVAVILEESEFDGWPPTAVDGTTASPIVGRGEWLEVGTLARAIFDDEGRTANDDEVGRGGAVGVAVRRRDAL